MAVSAILLAFLTSSKKATMLQSLCLVGLYGLYMVVLFVTDKLWSTVCLLAQLCCWLVRLAVLVTATNTLLWER